MTYPLLMRTQPTPGATPEQLATGKFTRSGGKYQWFYWLREPVVSPDGKTIALVSDAPDPASDDVVLQFMSVATGKLTKPTIAESLHLGHQDPAWSPDGGTVLYVKNGADGARGAASIWRYNVKTKRTAALTGPGYIQPAYSPDGQYVAVTRTTTLATDIVILNARTGAEALRVTSDGQSWNPVWSPAGDGVAFLHENDQIVDLRLAKVSSGPSGLAVQDTKDLTLVSGLDSSSRPSWYIPASQLPAPTPTPSPSAAASSAPPSTLP